MDELDQIRLRHFDALAGALLELQAREVVSQLKRLPRDLKLSGDDSKLESFWEEFNFQIQYEESLAFEVYEEAIRATCGGVVAGLSREVQGLLWLATDQFNEREPPEEIPYGDPITEALLESLYARVCELAEGEELKYDPNDDLARDRFERDNECDS